MIFFRSAGVSSALRAARPAMAHFVKTHGETGVIQRSAGDDRDGMVVQEENQRFRTGTFLEDRLAVETRVKDRWPRLRQVQPHAAPVMSANAPFNLVNDNHC